MVKSAFYCALCDKQYERISDYEVHLSSYDHNHKKVPNKISTQSDTHTHTFSNGEMFEIIERDFVSKHHG